MDNSNYSGLKGGAQFFLGFGTLLLILVVAYVLIYITNQQQATQIADGISSLATAVKGK
ncbi:hypothetical protein HY989_05145 [Candidatus Micrarchaeota archaeon]|nr:hypothetical protein [Candidatus Micrarchaeota archaeon]